MFARTTRGGVGKSSLCLGSSLMNHTNSRTPSLLLNRSLFTASASSSLSSSCLSSSPFNTSLSNSPPCRHFVQKEYHRTHVPPPAATSSNPSSRAVQKKKKKVSIHDITALQILKTSGKLKRTNTIPDTLAMREVALQFAELKASCLVVVDTSEDVLGIITERDCLRAFSRDKQWETRPVNKCMTRFEKIVAVSATDSASECLKIMALKGVIPTPHHLSLSLSLSLFCL